MPGQKTDPLIHVDALSERVDALLAEINEACDEVVACLSEDDDAHDGENASPAKATAQAPPAAKNDGGAGGVRLPPEIAALGDDGSNMVRVDAPDDLAQGGESATIKGPDAPASENDGESQDSSGAAASHAGSKSRRDDNQTSASDDADGPESSGADEINEGEAELASAAEVAPVADAPPTDDAPAPEPQQKQPGTLSDLDSQLADLADELLTGDIEDISGNPIETLEGSASGPIDADSTEQDFGNESAQTPVSSAPDAAPGSKADPAGKQPTPASAAVDAPSKNPAPNPAPSPAPSQTKESAKDAKPAKPRPAGKAADKPESQGETGDGPRLKLSLAMIVAAARATGAALRHAEPKARKIAMTLDRPLERRPGIVRDTIGWIAIWTGFLALSVWIVLVFFRSADQPTPAQSPPTLSEPTPEERPREDSR